MPGPLGSAVEEGGEAATVLASLEEAFQNAPKYLASTRSGAWRCNKAAGLSGGRSLADEEFLSSSSPFFHVKGKELKRAAQRYVALPDCPELSKVKAAMAQCIGPGRMYTGASVTCRELTREHVCNELMECAASVCLTVPAVRASLRHFITELRLDDDVMSRFFEDPMPDSSGEQYRPSSGYIPTSRPQYNQLQHVHPVQQAKRPFPSFKRTPRRHAMLLKCLQEPYVHESS